MKTNYTILWEGGNHENPSDGFFYIDAWNMEDAIRLADAELRGNQSITGVIESETWRALEYHVNNPFALTDEFHRWLDALGLKCVRKDEQ